MGFSGFLSQPLQVLRQIFLFRQPRTVDSRALRPLVGYTWCPCGHFACSRYSHRVSAGNGVDGSPLPAAGAPVPEQKLLLLTVLAEPPEELGGLKSRLSSSEKGDSEAGDTFWCCCCCWYCGRRTRRGMRLRDASFSGCAFCSFLGKEEPPPAVRALRRPRRRAASGLRPRGWGEPGGSSPAGAARLPPARTAAPPAPRPRSPPHPPSTFSFTPFPSPCPSPVPPGSHLAALPQGPHGAFSHRAAGDGHLAWARGTRSAAAASAPPAAAAALRVAEPGPAPPLPAPTRGAAAATAAQGG